METQQTNEVTSVHSSAHSDGLQVQHIGEQVRDEETGEIIEVTEELQQEALKAHGQLEGAFFQLGNALYNIKERKLFAALGYNSFKEYCRDTLPFGVRSAYDYALIGEHYGTRLLDDGANSSAQYEKIGLKKLKLIAQHASDQVDTLIGEGKIEVEDDQYTTEDLQKTTVNKLQSQLKKANEQAERTKELEYQKQLTEKENQDLIRENKELEQYKTIRQQEEELKKGLDQISSHIESANRMLNSLEMAEAPEHLQQEFVRKMDYYFDLLEQHREKYQDLFINYSE